MIGIIAAALVVGQAISYVLSPASWLAYASRLATIFSMIAFWGPIIAIIAGLFVWGTLRLMGFSSLKEIRDESVEQNNPTPAILFTGTLIAALLFLMIVIRP
jgi:heme/copper-type cytochrome/quinol oxidase subunit 2